MTVTDVFTPGRIPIFTYNPRVDHDPEGAVQKYLDNGGAALVLSGPTKAGKTVVIDRLLPQHAAVWVNGSDLRVVDDLWNAVIDFLGLFDQLGVQVQATAGKSAGVGGKIGVPGAELTGQLATTGGQTETKTSSVSRPVAAVARQAMRDVKLPLVIDDFHYVHHDIQVELARVVKTVIPFSPVVMIAVPQDAFSVVRAETDLVGRIWQVSIEPWSEGELQYIARHGFDTLNLVDPGGTIAAEFARHSLGAPYLMQQLCLEYCLSIGVRERSTTSREVFLPQGLLEFYKGVASRTVPAVFDQLKAGPRTKGQPRLARTRSDGEVTDIYGAILDGISKMGPVSSMTIQQLAHKIADNFVPNPQLQNITSALGHMSSIAHNNRRGGDAVLEYKNDTLYIADPFLSFYLRFGDWKMPSLPADSI